MKKTISVIVAFFLVPYSADANTQQNGNATQKPSSSAAMQQTIDPQKIAAAKELVNIDGIGASGNLKEYYEIMLIKKWHNLMTAKNPGKDDQIDWKASDVGDKLSLLHKDDIKNDAAVIYTNKFSLEELQQIIAFRKSPTGGKYFSSMASMFDEESRLDGKRLERVGEEATQELVKGMKKEGLNIPEEMETKIDHNP